MLIPIIALAIWGLTREHETRRPTSTFPTGSAEASLVRGSAAVTPASQPQLENVARILAANPSVRIHIRGYSDPRTPQGATELQQARAETVQQAFIDHGVDASRLEVETTERATDQQVMIQVIGR